MCRFGLLKVLISNGTGRISSFWWGKRLRVYRGSKDEVVQTQRNPSVLSWRMTLRPCLWTRTIPNSQGRRNECQPVHEWCEDRCPGEWGARLPCLAPRTGPKTLWDSQILRGASGCPDFRRPGCSTPWGVKEVGSNAWKGLHIPSSPPGPHCLYQLTSFCWA